MITTRTPVRLPLGGGGTDLPFFYPKYGGFLITAAIDKYIYTSLNERPFRNEFRIAYSKTENVPSIDDIMNTRVREALKFMKINKFLDISTMAEVPSNTGMGSSSSFLIGLLRALHSYKREYVDTRTLAEEACEIEINILKEPIGKQDQYIAAYGGLQSLLINKQGGITISPINISLDTIKELEHNLHIFYTGIQRNATEVIKDQSKKALSNEQKMGYMKEIKNIGMEIKKCLETDNLKRFGEWMNIHWETKKKMSDKMSNPQIDKWYSYALKNGALGGKIMGAGGGGFFVFYCDKNIPEFKKKIVASGLEYVPFRFDMDGSKILFDAK